MIGTRIPALESDALTRQIERVAAELEKLVSEVEIVLDALGEPVALRVSKVLTPEQTDPIVAAATRNGADLMQRRDNPELSDVLPYGTRSGMAYPWILCEVLDAVARAITGHPDVAAARLAAPEGGLSIGVGDAGPHTDFPGSLADPPATDIHGFNVHVTLQGTGSARFSPVRSFEQVRAITERIQSEKRKGRTVIEINDLFPELYGPFLEVASAPVRVTTGDLLLFQARPHMSKGLLPTVHLFESFDADRWNNVFVPKSGSRREISELRADVAARYRLEALGYLNALREGSFGHN
ncbi:hypothetical protein ACIBEK_05680 [Nocardia fusca]|uniref:hypothetical protein n=1 Tax=Nocardia fusca TaxID=941183 RepID=UPI0037B9785D